MRCASQNQPSSHPIESSKCSASSLTFSILILFSHLLLILGITTKSVPFFGPPQTAKQPAASQVKTSSRLEPEKPILRLPDTSQGSGCLTAYTPNGEKLGNCPLKHTSVKAKISGYAAKVTVTQLFVNGFKTPIEAIYTFPLDADAAVETMEIKIGGRVVRGTIRSREEANRLYEHAREQGKTAALLEQERANIFTQSLVNIAPESQVTVTLTYISFLKFESGNMTFTFPTTIGPRFIPSPSDNTIPATCAQAGVYTSDSMRISPPMQTRAGHDLSISVSIEHGGPIDMIVSALHPIHISKDGPKRALVTLLNQHTLPNKDFVLSWHVGTSTLKTSVLTHRNKDDGFVTLMLMPPDRGARTNIAPKDLIFVIDCSGSQAGAPLKSAKDTLCYIIDHLSQNDAFQVLAFSDRVSNLFEKPERLTGHNKQRAFDFINNLEADGGTFMASAVEAACATGAENGRIRIVTFMTDGFVGNDEDILGLVRKLRKNSRWFSFGTGNSVNRFLIDGIAREGGGEAEYVLPNRTSEQIAREFWNKISSPVLTNVSINFKGLPVKEVYPSVVSDVWSHRPLYFIARYEHSAKGKVTLTGFHGGTPYREELSISLPESNKKNESLGSVWARKKVDALSSEDYLAGASANQDRHKEEITQVGIKHHILTKYTAFVAVDENATAEPTKKLDSQRVPVESPDGLGMQSSGYGLIEFGSYNDTYMGVQKFWGEDIIANFFQTIVQLINQWIADLIDGCMSEGIGSLTALARTLVVTPIPLILSDTLRKVGLLAGIAIAVFLMAKERKLTPNCFIRCFFVMVILISSPILTSFALQTTCEIAKLISLEGLSSSGSVQGAPLETTLTELVRSGLLSMSGLIMSSLDVVFGTHLDMADQLISSASLFVYLACISMLIVQLCRLVVVTLTSSAVVTGLVLLGPIFIASLMTRRSQPIAMDFLKTVAESAIWFTAWIFLLDAVWICLATDINPYIQMVLVLVILELMIRIPSIFSVLHISPISTLVRYGSIRAFVIGTKRLGNSFHRKVLSLSEVQLSLTK